MWIVLFLLAPLVGSVVLPSILEPFDRAAARTGRSKKELAYSMSTTPQRLAHMLHGQSSALSVARLLLAPTDFFKAFTEELCAVRGVGKPLTAEDVLDLFKQGGQKCA